MSLTHRITSVENIEGRGLHTKSVYIQEDDTNILGPSVEEKFQAAYEEYIKTMEYKTLEEAFNEKPNAAVKKMRKGCNTVTRRESPAPPEQKT